jgi:hypothetical protein
MRIGAGGWIALVLLGLGGCPESAERAGPDAGGRADASDGGTGGDGCVSDCTDAGRDGGGLADACACGPAPIPQALVLTALADSVDLVAPGRGAESWHGQDPVDVPLEGARQPALDAYHRSWFTWARLEPSQDAYDFSRLADELHAAIDQGQKFSFGLMTIYPGDETNPSPTDQGVGMSYPLYLHQRMQDLGDPLNHGATDWNCPAAGWWLPNYNSEHYLDRLDALHVALNAWLQTGSYAGVAYRDVIGYIDVRGFGSWGEWHHYPFLDAASSPDGSAGSWPVGMRPSVATLKRIVDSHVNGFPDFQLAALISAFDAEYFNNTWNPPAIAQHVLDARNNVGPLGWRRDQWGSGENYIHAYLDQNDRSFDGGPAFKIAIMERWKFAPILGEPECSGSDLALLPEQVSLYHATMVGNGNLCIAPFPALSDNYRAAVRRMGYRVVVTGGAAPGSVRRGQRFTMTLAWHNVGHAPTYEDWNVTFELQDRASGAVAWAGTSSHRLRRWLPSTTPTTVDDSFDLPLTLPTGPYRLVVKVVDPTGYRQPLPLAIEGRRADGSYTLIDTVDVGDCDC